jgi:hypothetical protein
MSSPLQTAIDLVKKFTRQEGVELTERDGIASNRTLGYLMWNPFGPRLGDLLKALAGMAVLYREDSSLACRATRFRNFCIVCVKRPPVLFAPDKDTSP